MPISIITICGLILGTAQWSTLERRAATVFPILQSDYFPGGDSFDEEEDARHRQLGIRLGVHKEWSIPMYYRHLLDNPKSADFRNVLIQVEVIGVHQRLFVPFALRRLEDKKSRDPALLFIRDFGGVQDAKAVADLLLSAEFVKEDPRVALDCLKKIGGKEDLNVLTQFANENIARKRKPQFAAEVDECRKAIEARLEAEAKAAALKK